jgi:hypothetical protein
LRSPRNWGCTGERELRQQVSQLKRVVADKTLEADFFKRCLAKDRDSTPEQKQVWRDGIYEQIREVMPMQGNLAFWLRDPHCD